MKFLAELASYFLVRGGFFHPRVKHSLLINCLTNELTRYMLKFIQFNILKGY